MTHKAEENKRNNRIKLQQINIHYILCDNISTQYETVVTYGGPYIYQINSYG